ncbi:hypothetical protein GPX89_24730 [Nocardia sp. ET3-3]|uniref:Uncharacterized protein n=1 Tax=Nocardia terrae TaxID=2675851 RepID=A0A7K1V1N0_9NOCA|nr:hypothetical protein [Nocardia terrae]MVU80441.1 hypothetical protein [Nocardia terrae]
MFTVLLVAWGALLATTVLGWEITAGISLRAYRASESCTIGDGMPTKRLWELRDRGKRYARISTWCGAACLATFVSAFATLLVAVIA